jgi:ABC-type branched-subunit amino acid transport system substrate-binding protein
MMLALVLVGAACGRSDDKGSGDGSDTTTTTTASDAKSASFGTLTDVCQTGKPSGSPTIGVTPTEIKVATFSDPGFAGRPGLNQEFFDTADVFAAWCNERGGINGRKIVVDKKDAALTNVKAKMTEACANDFAMVGGGAVFDQDGVETRLQCLLPDIAGFVVSIKARGSDLLVQPVPNSVKTLQVGAMNYLGKKFPEAVDKAGALTGDLSTTKAVMDQQVEAAEAAGWKFVYNDQYPAAGATDWTPYAQQIKSSGVKGLFWVGEPENLAALTKALKNIGYKLDFIRTDANHYDQKLIEIAADALSDENVYVQSGFYPFEKAKSSNATGQYLDAFKQYKPDGKNRTNLGLQAWSSWLLFAQAAKECGNDLTRTCLYDNAKKVTDWTGGGLHAATDPGSGESGDCVAVQIATPTGFKLATDTKPNDGIYQCSPKNVYTLKGDYGTGLTLADVGQDIKNLK